MAVIQNPIIGRAKNKFSNAIFSTWVGKNVLRSKPLSVANPRTERQIINRERIAFLARIAKGTREIILITMRSLRQGQTQYNALAKINYPSFAPPLNGNGPDVWISPDSILLSTNTMSLSGVTLDETTETVSFAGWTNAQRTNTDMYVAFWNVQGNTTAPEPFLSVASYGEGVGNTMDINKPAGAMSYTVVLVNRLTGENAQIFGS